MLKDIFNLDLVFIILALVIPIAWAEDRRRRQILDIIKAIHAGGQIVPPEVWERLLQRGGSAGSGSAWTLPIVLVSAAAGFLLAAAPFPMEWREAKLFLAFALTCLVAAAGTAFVARSRRRNEDR